MKVQRDGFRQSEFADDQGSQTRLARDSDTKQSDDVSLRRARRTCRQAFQKSLVEADVFLGYLGGPGICLGVVASCVPADSISSRIDLTASLMLARAAPLLEPFVALLILRAVIF